MSEPILVPAALAKHWENEARHAWSENARLKAEVERLEKGIQPEGCNDAVGRAVNVLLEKEKEIARLKAKVERLTKAGDDLAKPLEVEGYVGAIKYWNAAKEGKQS